MRFSISNPSQEEKVAKLQELLGCAKPADAVIALIELKAPALIAELTAISQPNSIGFANTGSKMKISTSVHAGKECPKMAASATSDHHVPKNVKNQHELDTEGHKITPSNKSVKISKTRRSLSDAVE